MDKNIFRFKGTLNRKYFIISLLIYFGVIVTIHYLTSYLLKSFEFSGINYFIVKSFLALVYLAIFTPFIVARLRDAALSPWWALILFVATIFDLRNFVLAQELWGVEVNPFLIPIIIITISSFVLYLVLLFKPGRYTRANTHGKFLDTEDITSR